MKRNNVLRRQVNQLKKGAGISLSEKIIRAASAQAPQWVKQQNELSLQMVKRSSYSDEILARTSEQWAAHFRSIFIHPYVIREANADYKKGNGAFSWGVMDSLISHPTYNGIPERTIEESQKMIAEYMEAAKEEYRLKKEAAKIKGQ